MARNYGNDRKSALQAKSDAQKIAFAPIMFQAAKTLRDLKILSFLRKEKDGKSLSEIANFATSQNMGPSCFLRPG